MKDYLYKAMLRSSFLNEFYNKIEFLKPIDKIDEKNNWQNKKILETINTKNEQLIALNSYDKANGKFIQLHKRIFPVPAYFKEKIQGSMPIIYVREKLVDLLLKVIDKLPNDYGIIVYDGYRSISVQQALFDKQYEIEKNRLENKNCTYKELENKTKRFVSIPSKNPTKPSTHNTGGAIDFSICDMNGNELNFGCKFDDFNDIANVIYFEEKYKKGNKLDDYEIEAMLNRRVLSNIGKSVGFSLYKSEWWHMDAFNQWDSKVSVATYGSCDINMILPNPNNDLCKYVYMNEDLHKHIKYLIK